MKLKQQFEYLPDIPMTFEAAVAAVKLAEQAMNYWELKTKGYNSAEKERAKLLLSRWKSYRADAQQSVESYQMRMF